jgi:hypothetical protein
MTRIAPRMHPTGRTQSHSVTAEHTLNVRSHTDELVDELRKNSHGTDLACGRKRRLHGGLGLVDLSGIEPLTSSLRKWMRLKSHGSSGWHDGVKAQILL